MNRVWFKIKVETRWGIYQQNSCNDINEMNWVNNPHFCTSLTSRWHILNSNLCRSTQPITRRYYTTCLARLMAWRSCSYLRFLRCACHCCALLLSEWNELMMLFDKERGERTMKCFFGSSAVCEPAKKFNAKLVNGNKKCGWGKPPARPPPWQHEKTTQFMTKHNSLKLWCQECLPLDQCMMNGGWWVVLLHKAADVAKLQA